jgi:hypothetical protein
MRIAVNINIRSPLSNGMIAGGHFGPAASGFRRSQVRIAGFHARQDGRSSLLVQLAGL